MSKAKNRYLNSEFILLTLHYKAVDFLTAFRPLHAFYSSYKILALDSY